MTKMKPLDVSYERCHELLEICEPSDFEKQSGLKSKVNRRGRARAGEWAGDLHKQVTKGGEIRKVWRVCIDNKRYFASRIIYFMTHGEDPYPLEVDHVNQDSRDNRIENLRLGDRKIQNQNRGINKNNKSGVKGVSKHECGKWVACIQVENKRKHLGYFTTLKEAAEARNAAVRKYWPEEVWAANLIDLDLIKD